MTDKLSSPQGRKSAQPTLREHNIYKLILSNTGYSVLILVEFEGLDKPVKYRTNGVTGQRQPREYNVLITVGNVATTLILKKHISHSHITMSLKTILIKRLELVSRIVLARAV